MPHLNPVGHQSTNWHGVGGRGVGGVVGGVGGCGIGGVVGGVGWEWGAWWMRGHVAAPPPRPQRTHRQAQAPPPPARAWMVRLVLMVATAALTSCGEGGRVGGQVGGQRRAAGRRQCTRALRSPVHPTLKPQSSPWARRPRGTSGSKPCTCLNKGWEEGGGGWGGARSGRGRGAARTRVTRALAATHPPPHPRVSACRGGGRTWPSWTPARTRWT